MGLQPRVKTESEPISELTKIVDPVKSENVAGDQINPATEDTLASVKTAVEIIDNFISGTKGLVTEDNSATIKTAVESAIYRAATPTLYNVTMTNAATEYSQALSANTKKFSIHTRDFSAFRFAYVTGKVATPTAPYLTVPAGGEISVDGVNLSSVTLYFASADAGKIVEIEEWV